MKKKLNFKLLQSIFVIPVCVIMLALSGCADSGSGGKSNDTGHTVGKFKTNNAPLTVPDGVTYSVKGPKGGDSTSDQQQFLTCITACNDNHPSSSNPQENMTCLLGCYRQLNEAPNDGAFFINLTLDNSNGTDQTVAIPAGSLFQPANQSTQPMGIVKNLSLTIADHSSDTFHVPSFCLAVGNGIPDEGDGFSYSGVITTSCYQEIVQILSQKNMNAFDDKKIITVQNVIWKCAAGNFTNTERTELNNL